ncbi:response regulator [Paenibacillus sp. IB182496]|uniref:Response regulator n=1 Tax=Paenibacillus sabuli TaxID=2772509 RepID=A0A927GSS0_9BACL|nr:response regulator [Paenibacillus sabuli]MBD2846858.1 response regulator [Paenibacillus sabuli]
MRVFLIDADARFLRHFERQLQAVAETQVVGSERDPRLALERVPALAPDVVFLDVLLPGMSGIGLANTLLEALPELQIVYVTRARQYALQAFNQQAADYLLKPVEPLRLARSIDRLRRMRAERTELRASQLERD